MAKVFITSGTTWAGVATDGSNITVECIGGGGGGSNGPRVIGQQSGGGGGGGEYRKSVVAYVSGTPVTVQIGQGGAGAPATLPDGVLGSDGTDTSFNSGQVVGKGGKGGSSVTPGVGGLGGTGGTGTVGNNGGAGGGTGNGSSISNGGGGAGGPNGIGGAGGTQDRAISEMAGGGGNGGGTAGGNAISGSSGNGGNNSNGTGGGMAGVFPALATAGTDGGGGGGGYDFGFIFSLSGAGGNGIDFDATHGSGGGGGPGGVSLNPPTGVPGAVGGLYGGGGGSCGVQNTAGSGTQGIIVITYTPVAPATAPANYPLVRDNWVPTDVSASSTDFLLISGVSTRQIVVKAISGSCDVIGTTLVFNSLGSASTPISMTFANQARGGFVLPYSSGGWFKTRPGESLTCTTGAGGVIHLTVVYEIITTPGQN